MVFGPVDPQIDLVALEKRVLDRWRDTSLAGRVADARRDGEPWIFYEGPPTANGRPGLHHVWARVFKDLFPRFQTMQGRRVPRKGGWDCHGLPVEIEVEKELGFTAKGDIEAYGIDKFNQRCRESVHRYVGDFEDLTERAGVWIDTANAYWTLSNDYIESVWWLVKRLFDDDLLYEGHRVSPYCPRCGTALSSHELGQPGAYRDVTDPSVYVRFPLLDNDTDLLVWTTTPWTLLSNVAAAVGADIAYVRVRAAEGGRDLIMAENLRPEGAEVVSRFTGSELVGRRYSRPFDLLEVDDRAGRVVAADFVSTESGSGIVHLAPAFGNDDMDVARAEDLPVLNPVGPDGRFLDTAGPWATSSVRDANPEIIADLGQRGLLVREEAYTHSYPHCWRCGTPLLYWAKTSWFVRTSTRRADMVAQNERVAWYPEHIKHGRFGDWLANNVDWALSRDRYWGTPLPVWRCESGHDTCVASRADLSRLSGRGDLADLDLHRPAVDEVTITCPAEGCGGEARRVTPVLDAWFDSGAMPSAQQHYPFDDDTRFTEAFPADFICEAIDQTRGWFYSLLAVNSLVFGSTPFLNVVCLAHVVDEAGQKMSKSKGNVIDPWQIFDSFGADALRWYFFSAGSPWTSRRVYEDGIRESTRRSLLTLWNLYSFFATYADIDGWTPPSSTPGDGNPIAVDHVMDRWALTRVDEAVTAVTEALEGFDALAGAQALAALIDDLSNWYVRRSRARFWGSPDSQAYQVLHHCLTTTARLLAPFCPFLADELYVGLTGNDSVHLADWPKVDDAVDEDLLAEMESARRLVVLGRSARTDAGIRTQQPLRQASVVNPGARLGDAVRAEVAGELNVKQVVDVEGLEDLMSWTIVPNFRALGPRLGPKVNDIKAALAGADGTALRHDLEAQGYFDIAGERLSADEVEVRAAGHAELALAYEGEWAVALDTEIDAALHSEGLARQLARALNDVRRRRGLELADRIRLVLEAPAALAPAIEAHRDWVAAQVLAVELVLGPVAGGTVSGGADTVEIDGQTVAVGLEVVTPG